jgi:hypothetical protein
MAQPAIGEGSFPAHRQTVTPNGSLQCNRSTAGCPPGHRQRDSVRVENRSLTVAASLSRALTIARA